MLPGLGVQALVPVAGELALERQQLIETTARVGIDREGAVVEFRAILGNLALGRLLVRAGPLQIVGHIAQRRAPQIGVREVGIELDRARVVADRGLVVAQLSVERGPVIINQHVVRRVERYPVVVVERPIIVADLRAQDRPVEIGQRIGRVERDGPRKVLDRLHRTLRARVDHSPGGNRRERKSNRSRPPCRNRPEPGRTSSAPCRAHPGGCSPPDRNNSSGSPYCSPPERGSCLSNKGSSYPG